MSNISHGASSLIPVQGHDSDAPFGYALPKTREADGAHIGMVTLSLLTLRPQLGTMIVIWTIIAGWRIIVMGAILLGGVASVLRGHLGLLDD